MRKKIKTIILLLSVLLPVFAMAQISDRPPQIQTDLIGLGNKIARAAWIVFTIIAVVCFVIAGVLFMTAQGNAEKIAQARNAFLWGVVGVVVGILAYTIIAVVSSILQ